MSLALVILAPFAGALLPLWLQRLGRVHAAWGAGAATALGLALLLPLAVDVFRGETLVLSWAWVPQFGINLAFRLDGLGLLFALLILGIGLLIILYARYYLPHDDRLGRFYAYLLLFQGAMLGIVLSENLLVLLVFWELTSLTSFLLIGYRSHLAESRQAARMALAITGAGGLAMLGGFILLGQIVGSYELTDILAAGDLIRGHELYVPTLILILLGAFTKSAQFPFHFWLPGAMAAPTPVSAYLHSATMVKAGVFMLARLFPVLSGTDWWSYIVGPIGLITLLTAAYWALFKHDLKGLLAYSTISHLGLITLLFGLGTPLGAVAGVFHIINHATFKASLFMAAGIIDHECGTRDMRRINGMFKYMPHTAVLAMVAAAAMAGVPLLNGFLSKEMFFEEAVHMTELGPLGWGLPMLATLAGVFSVTYSARFIHDVFFNGEPIDLPRTPHEPPRWMKIPVEILVAICLLVGMLPAVTVGPLLAVAAGGVLQAPLPEYSLAIWHGLTTAFVMSLIALGGGLLLYTQRERLFRLHDRFPEMPGARVYEWLLDRVYRIGTVLTRWLDGHSLQRYAAYLIAVCVALGLAGYLLAPEAVLKGPMATRTPDVLADATTLLLIIGAVATVVWHRQRLVALVVVGVVGLMISLTFVRFSAPDLALTQLTVEVVTIVLMLLALYFLPRETPIESHWLRRMRDGGLAIAAGAGAGLLSWAMFTRPHDTISGFFLEQSVPGGGGTNVVNVILVDFRGFDTLGEITVLAMAAIGVHAMLEGLRLKLPTLGWDGRPWARSAHPLFLAVLSRVILPFALVVAFYVLLRGHNQPGGGFIAGLVTGVALILQYLGNGIAWTQERFVVRYHVTFAVGLFVATAAGLGSWWFQRPFLTSAHGYLHVPLIGDLHLATAMIFDVGVYVTVVGAVLLILAELGRLSIAQSERATRPEHVVSGAPASEGA